MERVNKLCAVALKPWKGIKWARLTTRFFCSPAMGIIRSDMTGRCGWVGDGIYSIQETARQV